MKYYVEGIGFVASNAQFTHDGVVYPRGTLLSFFPDAVPQPEAFAGQRVVEGEEGWEFEDIPQAEFDAVTEQQVALVWQERHDIANDPMNGLDPSGAVIVREMANAGNVKAQAIAAWVQSLYDEAVEREAAVRAGEELGDWATDKQKPYSVSDALAEE